MPFTPSHAALALPFLRTPLLPAALVIGTVAPDIPYFVPLEVPREFSHSVGGVFTIDVAIGIALFALWHGVLRQPVVDLAPAWLRERMPRQSPADWIPVGRRWLAAFVLLVASLVLGSLTHIAWDSFTHPGWVVDHLALLRTQFGPLTLAKWLQHMSSAAGIAILTLWTIRWARRTSRENRLSLAGSFQRIGTWIAIVAGFGIAGLATWFFAIAQGNIPFDPNVVFRVARVSIGVAGAVALCAVGAWWIVRWRVRSFASSALANSDGAEYRDDLAEHLGVITQNRLE